ncbi:uncharacterized protein LOC116033496 isoform X1 [Ipomoea triloba]|uniref:uncharacterized protein LOC116033496 isoform X1 n=1 Tax=Ipomoea triloba TaxID=35885 RepID=UPI00125E341A|nr:uncharacterized protein LOC116033496 isoform X1 [Ipomoea triloba]
MEMEKLRSSVGANGTQLPDSCHSLNKPAEDLIREIAVLEVEVEYLEKYLLAMYRERFSEWLGTIGHGDSGRHDWIIFNKKDSREMQKKHSVAELDDPSILRCQSSLSHTACSFRISPPIAEALDSCHSLPDSLQHCAQQSTANNVDQLCSFVSRQVHESPNWLSEEMIKCISAIYCKLASPSSALGLQTGEHSSFHSWSDNPFRLEEPSVTAVELRGLCRHGQSLNRVHHVLQRFRSLVSQMEQIDPRKMKHEEKLAFWINVHNALVMHAFLVYGIPRSNLKRASLLLKAAYNIGGKAVSVEMIQSCILRCQLARPGQWLQLFFPKLKFKPRDPRRAYAIQHEEPRLRFALCSGCHSDPVVRLYTPKRVFQDLEVAKEEYFQMNIRVHKEQKLLMPRNIECFVKEVGLCSSGLPEMIDQSLPEKFREKFRQTDAGKLWKKIVWVPHSFSFRYLISNELAEGVLSV